MTDPALGLRRASALLAAMLLFGGVAAARAPEQTSTHHEPGSAVVGTLVAVDLDGRRITVQTPQADDGQSLSIALQDTTEILQNGEPLPPTALSAETGRRVKVRYLEVRGHAVARAVTVAGSAPAESARPRSPARRPTPRRRGR